MTERELQKRLNHVWEQKAKAVAEVGRLESEVSKAINRSKAIGKRELELIFGLA
ncbi:hypothetical protein HAL013_07050 [Helicobacter ailurogastricus]|uniref:Uncharacterized protein n=1 Tax=Helicobacter ailurogastricus TaxID=1578720 RepID=A0A0K2XCB6_9HELI|nr:hypothetical protein HAL011_07240 [Helicobacter ailurogastricus]CRF42517.1 hypothetical protein HAL013_07050 [Helicobacter ailurogastricus]CRF44177.1 hypothetical protein HAL09_07500 [Helicobacter ailurogastricus]